MKKITRKCPHCQLSLSISVPAAARVRCPSCRGVFTPPVSGEKAETPAPDNVATTDFEPQTPEGNQDTVQFCPPNQARSDSLPDQRKIGRFEVRRFLGEGAFGAVYKAYDPQLDRNVAIKVAKLGRSDSEQRVKRFLREAKAAAGLRHPHIVPVHEFGKENDTFFIVASFVNGKSLQADLKERLQDKQPVDLKRAARIVHQLADALAYAHGQGIVHRDVKPANVMLDEKDEPMLMDFGLATRQVEAEKLTHAGAVLGTPLYMAPEQATGRTEEVRSASDQYSLGVMLYEMIAAQPPFEGTPELVMYHHVKTEPVSPRTRNAAVPRDLETIVLKCLEKDPAKRYADCRMVAEDLRRFIEGEPITARRISLVERTGRWVRREPRLAAALLGVLLALCALVAVLVISGRQTSQLLADIQSESAEKTEAQARLLSETNEKVKAGQAALSEANLRDLHTRTALYSSTFQSAVKAFEAGRYAESGTIVKNGPHALAGWEMELLEALQHKKQTPLWTARDGGFDGFGSVRVQAENPLGFTTTWYTWRYARGNLSVWLWQADPSEVKETVFSEFNGQFGLTKKRIHQSWKSFRIVRHVSIPVASPAPGPPEGAPSPTAHPTPALVAIHPELKMAAICLAAQVDPFNASPEPFTIHLLPLESRPKGGEKRPPVTLSFPSEVAFLSFSDDGQYLAAASPARSTKISGEIRVWRCQGEPVKLVNTIKKAAGPLTFSRTLSGIRENKICFWRPEEETPVFEIEDPRESSNDVPRIAHHYPGSFCVSCGLDLKDPGRAWGYSGLKTWDLEYGERDQVTGAKLATWTFVDQKVETLSLIDSQYLLAVVDSQLRGMYSRRNVRITPATHVRPDASLGEVGNEVLGLACSPFSSDCVVFCKNRVYSFRLDFPEPDSVFGSAPGPLTAFDFSTDGKTVAIASGVLWPDDPGNKTILSPAEVSLWDLASKKPRWTCKLQEESANPTHIRVTKQAARVVVCTASKQIVVFETDRQEPLTRFSISHSNYETRIGLKSIFVEGSPDLLAVSQDGKWAATAAKLADRGEVRVWNLQTGKLETELAFHHVPLAVFFSPDSTQIGISQQSAGVMLWEPFTTKKVVTFADINHADSFGSDGTTLVTRHGPAGVWNARSGNPIKDPEQRIAAMGTGRTVKAQEGRVFVHDVATGQSLGSIPIFAMQVNYSARDGNLYVLTRTGVQQWRTHFKLPPTEGGPAAPAAPEPQ